MRFDRFKTHFKACRRMRGRDYTALGMYFVTICTQDRECIFGDVREGKIILNEFGMIADRCWRELPKHFLFLGLDAFVIMPNHVHGILHFHHRGHECKKCIGIGHSNPQRQRPGIMCANGPECSGRACSAATSPNVMPYGPLAASLSAVVRSYKSAVSKEMNIIRGIRGSSLWQRNYHDRIIRNEEALHQIRRYIAENPPRWSEKHSKR